MSANKKAIGMRSDLVFGFDRFVSASRLFVLRDRERKKTLLEASEGAKNVRDMFEHSTERSDNRATPGQEHSPPPEKVSETRGDKSR
jgi:hypothetical protein